MLKITKRLIIVPLVVWLAVAVRTTEGKSMGISDSSVSDKIQHQIEEGWNADESSRDQNVNVTIISRAQWGARPPRGSTTMRLPVGITVIHHSVMGEGECNTTAQCTRVMKEIQDFHMDDNGWDDVGYSFLVGGDGNVYEGRGWNKVGAHSPGYNDKSIGICLIGNFMERLPSDSQMNAAKALINYGIDQNYITRNYGVYGHRDVRETECPGDQLYEEISQWPEKLPAP